MSEFAGQVVALGVVAALVVTLGWRRELAAWFRRLVELPSDLDVRAAARRHQGQS